MYIIDITIIDATNTSLGKHKYNWLVYKHDYIAGVLLFREEGNHRGSL